MKKLLIIVAIISGVSFLITMIEELVARVFDPIDGQGKSQHKESDE
jgi:hypothetical protein